MLIVEARKRWYFQIEFNPHQKRPQSKYAEFCISIQNCSRLHSKEQKHEDKHKLLLTYSQRQRKTETKTNKSSCSLKTKTNSGKDKTILYILKSTIKTSTDNCKNKQRSASQIHKRQKNKGKGNDKHNPFHTNWKYNKDKHRQAIAVSQKFKNYRVSQKKLLTKLWAKILTKIRCCGAKFC